LLGWLCLTWPLVGSAQPLRVVKTIALDKPQRMANDRYGNIYVADQEGNLNRYDSLGVFSLNFSPTNLAEISLLEARPTVRIFAFYRELQEYVLLDRFLAPIDHFRLDLPELGFVRVAAPSLDNQLWLYDDVNFSIKKFDKQANRITFRVPLDLLFGGTSDYDINYLAEYQNQLFVNDRNSGILRFDNLGNFIRKIATQTEVFNFWENELYFLENGRIRFVHLYQAKERHAELPPDLEGVAKQVIVQGSGTFILTESQLIFCK
jgi:hypothetical protein